MNESKILHLSSKVLKLSEVDSRFIELEMVVSNTDPNLNGVVTTKEFLQNKSDTLIDMPLVVDKNMLEAGFTNSLTHKFDGENLNTDIIGVFKEVWLESSIDDPDFVTMKAKAIVYKRFPQTIDAIKELFTEDNLKFSWELIATDVTEENGLAYINDGEFEGHCIVSNPAYGEDAVATKLVAEAYMKDMNNLCVCEQEEDSKEEGGKAIEMNYLAEILKEKSIDEVRAEIRMAIAEASDTEKYGIYIYEMYQSQVIYEQWDKETYESEYFRVPFTVSENEVSVDMESKKEVIRVWMDKPESDDGVMMSDTNDRKLSEEKTELETKVSELEEQLKVLSEAQVEEPVVEEPKVEEQDEDTIVSEEEVQEPVEEPDEKDVELAEKVIALSEELQTLKSEVESLRPFKEQVEKEEEEKRIAEEEANKTRLSELVKKFTKEDEIPEEVETLISEMDEKGIKLWIAQVAIEATKDVEEDDEDIIVGTAEEDELVESKEKFELV